MIYYESMRKYELTVLLDGKATAAKKKSVKEKLDKLIEVNEGKLGTFEDWGEKDLAFPIKKSMSGIFLHFPLELNPDRAKNLSSKLKVEDEILRYLLVKNEEGKIKKLAKKIKNKEAKEEKDKE